MCHHSLQTQTNHLWIVAFDYLFCIVQVVDIQGGGGGGKVRDYFICFLNEENFFKTSIIIKHLSV